MEAFGLDPHQKNFLRIWRDALKLLETDWQPPPMIDVELDAARTVLRDRVHPAEGVPRPAGPDRTQEVGFQNANEPQWPDLDMEMPARDRPNAATDRIEVKEVALRRAADPLTSAERREFTSLQERMQDGEGVGDYGSAWRLQAQIEEDLFRRDESLASGPNLSGRNDLRGAIDNRERETVAIEIDAAGKAIKEHDLVSSGGLRPDAMPSGPGAGDGKLHRDDIDAAVAKRSAESGLAYTPAAEGEFVAGVYRQSLTLTSGKFAMIDNGVGFALVPWTQDLDRHLGRHVAGVARESGGVEWSLWRKRGLEI